MKPPIGQNVTGNLLDVRAVPWTEISWMRANFWRDVEFDVHNIIYVQLRPVWWKPRPRIWVW